MSGIKYPAPSIIFGGSGIHSEICGKRKDRQPQQQQEQQQQRKQLQQGQQQQQRGEGSKLHPLKYHQLVVQILDFLFQGMVIGNDGSATTTKSNNDDNDDNGHNDDNDDWRQWRQ